MRGAAQNVSFWDVEDGEDASIVKVRDTTLGPVATRDVQEFCERYHYTHTGGAMAWRYGLWHNVTLLGVVAYNLPTRETCESVFGAEHFEHVWHMGRLAMSDDAPRNSESRLISLSLKAIQREHPHVWGVLTYAASSAGHIGYVYQATNALYTGEGGTGALTYVDQKGRQRPNHHINRAQALARGWTPMQPGIKHRYLYVLGNKTQRRERMRLLLLDQHPYPKATQEIPHARIPDTDTAGSAAAQATRAGAAVC